MRQSTVRKPTPRRGPPVFLRPAPTCVRVPVPDEGPLCPDCRGETFFFEDDDGTQLVCLDCVAYTAADCAA